MSWHDEYSLLPCETSLGSGTHSGRLRVFIGEINIGSGFGHFYTNFTEVLLVLVAPNNASAVADGISWTTSGSKTHGNGTVVLDASNASASGWHSVLAIGI